MIIVKNASRLLLLKVWRGGRPVMRHAYFFL